ncbi:EF-hand domain-containing protein [Nocardia sp. CA-129566]|uniref:EF-hand domain-containing protein n=1 Tax=Nocardia sp. CA-129566 TaxID=3239976 RepID=UPI003D99F824
MDNRDILDAFKAMDRDRDGFVSREEFFEHYENQGKHPEDIEALFDRIDMDGDGKIIEHEFLAAAAGGRI